MTTPPDFADLEKFFDDWALATDAERLNKRMTSGFDELLEFHEAMNQRLEELVEFLNQFPYDEIPQEHQKLAYLALAAVEVDDPATLWKASRLEMAQDPRIWRNKKNYYDNQPPEQEGADGLG